MKVYSSREVAKLLGISLRQVYGHARAGFLKPARGKRRAYRFSFQDLVLLRAARTLADANIPARRVRSAFRRLVRELPEGHSLGSLRISAEGRRIVARDGTRTWNPESGQLQLDFRGVRPVGPVGATAFPAGAGGSDPHVWTGRGHTGLGSPGAAAVPGRRRPARRRVHHLTSPTQREDPLHGQPGKPGPEPRC